MSETIGFGDNKKSLTIPQEPKTLASVQAAPDEVILTLELDTDNSLTADQAQELGQMILDAAAEARQLDWADTDGESLDMVKKAAS